MVTRNETIQDTNTSKNPVGSLIRRLQNKLKNYCSFWSICPYFDIESTYCSNTGGTHCGKYRQYKTENSSK
jgi:uncharacterized protein YutD